MFTVGATFSSAGICHTKEKGQPHEFWIMFGKLRPTFEVKMMYLLSVERVPFFFIILSLKNIATLSLWATTRAQTWILFLQNLSDHYHDCCRHLTGRYDGRVNEAKREQKSLIY